MSRTAAPLLIAAAAAARPGCALASARWRRPVGGPAVGLFTYDAARPFLAGQRRGVDFAADAGVRVRAPCTGRVTFAGPVPGGRGLLEAARRPGTSGRSSGLR